MKNHKAIITSLLIVTVLFSLFVSSCTKDASLHLLPNAAITINSPTATSVYQPNDTVKITGTITSDSTVHGYTIYLRNKADKSSIAVMGVHDHTASITIDKFWVNTLTPDTTNVELEIIANLDHDGNSIGKKVYFKCVP